MNEILDKICFNGKFFIIVIFVMCFMPFHLSLADFSGHDFSFDSLNTGSICGQDGWTYSQGDGCTDSAITTDQAQSGTKSFGMAGTSLSAVQNSFGAESAGTITFYIKPTYNWMEYTIRFFYDISNPRIDFSSPFNDQNFYTNGGYNLGQLPLNVWNKISFNFDNDNYDVYINDILIVSNLTMYNTQFDTLGNLKFIYQNMPGSYRTYFDSFTFDSVPPPPLPDLVSIDYPVNAATINPFSHFRGQFTVGSTTNIFNDRVLYDVLYTASSTAISDYFNNVLSEPYDDVFPYSRYVDLNISSCISQTGTYVCNIDYPAFLSPGKTYYGAFEVLNYTQQQEYATSSTITFTTSVSPTTQPTSYFYVDNPYAGQIADWYISTTSATSTIVDMPTIYKGLNESLFCSKFPTVYWCQISQILTENISTTTQFSLPVLTLNFSKLFNKNYATTTASLTANLLTKNSQGDISVQIFGSPLLNKFLEANLPVIKFMLKCLLVLMFIGMWIDFTIRMLEIMFNVKIF